MDVGAVVECIYIPGTCFRVRLKLARKSANFVAIFLWLIFFRGRGGGWWLVGLNVVATLSRQRWCHFFFS